MFALIILEDRRFLDVRHKCYVCNHKCGCCFGCWWRQSWGVPIFAAGVCLIGGADVEIVEATAIYKGLKFAVDRHLLFCSLC